MTENISLPFNPTKWQQQVIKDWKRFNVLVVHRSAGKSWLLANLLRLSAIADKSHLPVGAYIAPELAQARKIAFDQLVDGLDGLAKINYQESWIQFHHNSAKLYLLGLSDAERLRGLHLNYCCIDEFGDLAPDVYGTIIRPTLERKKAWVAMIGTPKQGDQLLAMYAAGKEDPENYQTKWLTIHDTEIYSEKEIASLKREYELRGDLGSFMQEYENSPTALLDKFYHRQYIDNARKSERVGNFPYVANQPVYAACDLGADGTAVWFAQKLNGHIRVIDYYEVMGAKLDVVFQYLASRDYIYKEIILPSDANQERINSDLNIAKQFQMSGYKIKLLGKAPVANGILEANTLIRYCQFNQDGCKKGIEALENFAAKVDKKTGLIMPTPVHDKYSHGSDAFRYLAMGIKDPGNVNGTLTQNIKVEQWSMLDDF